MHLCLSLYACTYAYLFMHAHPCMSIISILPFLVHHTLRQHLPLLIDTRIDNLLACHGIPPILLDTLHLASLSMHVHDTTTAVTAMVLDSRHAHIKALLPVLPHVYVIASACTGMAMNVHVHALMNMFTQYTQPLICVYVVTMAYALAVVRANARMLVCTLFMACSEAEYVMVDRRMLWPCIMRRAVSVACMCGWCGYDKVVWADCAVTVLTVIIVYIRQTERVRTEVKEKSKVK